MHHAATRPNSLNPRRRSPVRASGLLLATLGLAIASVVAGGCVVNSSANYTVTRAAQTAHAAGSAVSVETNNGAITIRRESRPDVEITAEVRATSRERAEQVVIVVERTPEGTLTVTVKWPDTRKSYEGCSFTIAIPEASGVKARTSNGAVMIEGLSGLADLETTNGRITVKNHAGPVTADTSNGAIELTDVAGQITAKTSNGRISIVMAQGSTGPVNARTSNGAIELTASTELGGTISMETSNGAITADCPGATVNISKKRGKVTLPKEGRTSTLKTSNGRITVKTRETPKV
jgi:hypothetical protein